MAQGWGAPFRDKVLGKEPQRFTRAHYWEA